ncbi:MAG: hypothetical protein TU35_002975 [Thermoproteus sp. AZ2]|uniref:Uncharacterized protein n=1 Tax=Thermoproteus sp. AZ2 TaxID=1609232 RepID=A0ACC6V0F8_9CREN
MHTALEYLARLPRSLVHAIGRKVVRTDLVLAAAVSVAVIVAILSMPELLLPMAEEVLKALNAILPLALFIIGVIHGLKPDEHTWPITVSYAMMQRSLRGVLTATAVFNGALTLVWTALSAAVGLLPNALFRGAYDWLVDVLVGVTMITIAAVYIHRGEAKADAPDYKAIWIHGLAASFGGDFFVVLALALAVKTLYLAIPTALVGLLFGIGSFTGQLAVVISTYRGLLRIAKAPYVLVRAGRMALLFLGFFLIGLGLYTLIFPN